jgi:hypothetical protein
MQRALVTTAAAIIVTALAVSTAGCGGSAATGAPPTVQAPTSGRPATVTQAGAKEAEVYVQVLRRYLSTPAENSFPGQAFKTVYVLNRAYPDAADPSGTHGRGAPIAPRTQHQVTAALAGMAHVTGRSRSRSAGRHQRLRRLPRCDMAYLRSAGSAWGRLASDRHDWDDGNLLTPARGTVSVTP